MAGVSTLGQALEQIQKLKDQQSLFADLSLQLTTGKKTQNFAGLGNDVLTSQRTRADVQSIKTYTNNIKNADRRINLMSDAIAQFKKQADAFSGLLIGFSQQSAHQQGKIVTYDDPLTTEIEAIQVGYTSGEPDVDLSTLRGFATKLYDFMVEILNTKDGDRYVFGGAETLTPPIANSGTLDAAIGNLITGWKAGTISTDNLIADLKDRTTTAGNPDALTDTIVGYSAALSAGNAGRVFVRIEANAEIDYTALANDTAFRDVLVALSYFKNDSLPPIADTYIPPNAYPGVPDALGAPGATIEEMKENFYKVFNSLTASVNAAIDNADKVAANIENARARITQIKIDQQQQESLLLTTVTDIEDIDLNEISIKISALRTQLQASYAVTAALQETTLVNFLTGR
jgi:flagellar hook-associated protein 3 FlgL